MQFLSNDLSPVWAQGTVNTENSQVLSCRIVTKRRLVQTTLLSRGPRPKTVKAVEAWATLLFVVT